MKRKEEKKLSFCGGGEFNGYSEFSTLRRRGVCYVFMDDGVIVPLKKHKPQPIGWFMEERHEKRT